MSVLILGLLIFLGAHSIRIFAEDWRTQTIARLGLYGWKGLYAMVSLVGFALIVWGYGLSREDAVFVWNPPVWTRHAAALLTLPAFILVAAAYVPGNRIKAALGHPMVAGVKLWAIAHLIANGRLGDIVLFGTFLAWAVLDFRAARRRDRLTGTHYPAGTTSRDATTAILGLAVWWAFAAYLHGWLIGVRPFG